MTMEYGASLVNKMMRYVFVLLLFISFGAHTKASAAQELSCEELTRAVHTAWEGVRTILNELDSMLPLAIRANTSMWSGDIQGAMDDRYQTYLTTVEHAASIRYNGEPLIDGNGDHYRAPTGFSSDDWMYMNFAGIDLCVVRLGLQGTALTTQANAATAVDCIQTAITTAKRALSTLTGKKRELKSCRHLKNRLQVDTAITTTQSALSTLAGKKRKWRRCRPLKNSGYGMRMIVPRAPPELFVDDGMFFALEASRSINVLKALVCNCKDLSSVVVTALTCSFKILSQLQSMKTLLDRDYTDASASDMDREDTQYQTLANTIDTISNTQFQGYDLINGNGPAHCVAQAGFSSIDTLTINFSDIDLSSASLELRSTDVTTEESRTEAQRAVQKAIEVTRTAIATLTANRQTLKTHTTLNEALQDAFISVNRRA